MSLFGSKKKEVQEDLRPQEGATAEVIPFPTAQVPDRLVEKDTQRSYEEAAESLGFEPAELVRAQLIAFFETENIQLYDYHQVNAWLTNKRKEAGAENWCWRPLREKDVIEEYRWGERSNGRWSDGFYNQGQSSCRPYDRLVPLHALQKVEKIEEVFGEKVKFLVSDYDDPDVDPFIMVRPTKMNSGGSEYMMIFDVWDEPGFGE